MRKKRNPIKTQTRMTNPLTMPPLTFSSIPRPLVVPPSNYPAASPPPANAKSPAYTPQPLPSPAACSARSTCAPLAIRLLLPSFSSNVQPSSSLTPPRTYPLLPLVPYLHRRSPGSSFIYRVTWLSPSPRPLFLAYYIMPITPLTLPTPLVLIGAGASRVDTSSTQPPTPYIPPKLESCLRLLPSLTHPPN